MVHSDSGVRIVLCEQHTYNWYIRLQSGLGNFCHTSIYKIIKYNTYFCYQFGELSSLSVLGRIDISLVVAVVGNSNSDHVIIYFRVSLFPVSYSSF